MQGHNAKPPQNRDKLDDIGLVQLARRKDGIGFRSIMQHNNRRLYRIARSVVPDDSKAEDMVHKADLRTFGSLGQSCGDSSLATCLTPITCNEALGRLRRHRPVVDPAVFDAKSSSKSQVIPFPLMSPDFAPGRVATHRQIRHLIGQAIDGRPEIFWVVFAITSNGVYQRAKP
jgi:RNA polymerase sigma-70 factor, ECF subfamily